MSEPTEEELKGLSLELYKEILVFAEKHHLDGFSIVAILGMLMEGIIEQRRRSLAARHRDN